MVLPVIAAGAARAAGSAAARGAVSTTARAGAQTAGRAAARTTQSTAQSSGRNIVRARRNVSNASSDRLNSRPNVTRSSGSARGQVSETTQQLTTNTEQDEEYSGDSVSNTESSGPVKYRIGWFVAFLLLGIAATLDAVELILDLAGTLLAGVGVVLGYIKDFISLVFFPVVFTLLGAPFWKGRKAKKKIVTMITGYIVEALPWIGAFMPATLISVAVTIYITRKEDEGNTNIEGSMNKNITRARRLTRRG